MAEAAHLADRVWIMDAGRVTVSGTVAELTADARSKTPSAAHPRCGMNATRVARHAGMELRMLLRNGEQLLLAFAIPLGLVIGGLLWGRQFGLDGNTFPASVIAVAAWSTAFTSLGVATGFERRYGVLERLVATPLTRADLIAYARPWPPAPWWRFRPCCCWPSPSAWAGGPT